MAIIPAPESRFDVPEEGLIGQVPVLQRSQVIDDNGPTIAETAGAYFRQENIIGAALNKENNLPDQYRSNPDFNAWDSLTADEQLDANFAVESARADSEEELNALRRQRDREMEDRQTMAEAGWGGLGIGLPIALLDPITFFGVGSVAVNAYRGGRSLLKGGTILGSASAMDATTQEMILQSQQVTRTFGESAINVTAATLLGGVLGVGFAKFKDYGVDQNTLKHIEQGFEVDTPPVNLGDSVGAAKVQGDVKIKGRVAQFLAKMLPFDPLTRTLNGTSSEARILTAQMVENPYEVTGFNGTAAESLAKLHDAKYKLSLQHHNEQFVGWKKANKGKIGDFNAAVSRAIRTGKSDSPEILSSANYWRNELYEPLKNEMVALKMLPEDVDVSTATNYLNRVWDRNKINANYDTFIKKVSDWLETKDLELYDAARIAASRIEKAVGEERAALQSIIDKAEFKIGRDFERQDYESLAGEIATRINGSPDGRLPYDWKMGSGQKASEFGQARHTAGAGALRGPLRERAFLIPDEMVEEFLENDIELLGRRYLDSVAGDIELVRRFGTVTLDAQIKKINEEFNLLKSGKTKEEGLKIAKQQDTTIRDIAGMRDRIRGTYGFSDTTLFTRMGRSARDLNYLRLMGGVTVSSLPDVARVFMAEGFFKTFKSGLLPLVTNLKGFNVAKKEAQRYGVGMEAITGNPQFLADVANYTKGETMIERGLQSAAKNFNKLNLLDRWTAGIKQLHAVTMQTSIFEGLSKGKFDKRLERLGIDKVSAIDMMAQVNKYGSYENGVWLTNAKNWDRPDLERMWGAAVRKESDRVIIIPGQEKPLFMSTEMGKTVFQFRSFMLSSTQRVLIAGLQGQDQNVIGGFLALTSMGMFSYYLKAQIAGRALHEDPASWIMEGIDRSGSTGVLTEFNSVLEKVTSNKYGARAALGVNTINSRFQSRSISESVLGPTLGAFNNAVDVINATTSGEPLTDADKKNITRLIPYQNLFYFRRGSELISEYFEGM